MPSSRRPYIPSKILQRSSMSPTLAQPSMAQGHRYPHRQHPRISLRLVSGYIGKCTDGRTVTVHEISKEAPNQQYMPSVRWSQVRTDARGRRIFA
jgi:homoaconitase/3-isopropylmalate dehydratase large subunit